jgi:septal ring factor EnvC (AmiA/AmiB activator)
MRRTGGILLALALPIGLFGQIGFAQTGSAQTGSAQTGFAQTGRLDDARQALARAQQRASTTATKAASLEAQAAEARAAAQRAHRAGAALRIELSAAQARVTAEQARLAEIDRARALQAEQLAAQRAPLAGLIATLQRMALRPQALALADPQSIDEIARTRSALAALTPAIAARTAAVQAAIADGRRLHAEGERTSARLADAERLLVARRAAFDRAERSALVRADSAASGADDVRQQLAALADELADRRALVASLGRDEKNSLRLAALAPPPLRVGNPGRTIAYGMPANGRVRIGMGELAPSGGRTRGLTIETAPSAAVLAPAAGRIAYAGPFRGYGEIIIIDHGHGWTSLLAGLARVETRSAQVDRGAPIGRMGRTPLLTIELRHHARPVDVAAVAAWRG